MVSQKSKKEKDKALAKILDSSNIQSRIKALKACLEALLSDEMKRYLCENSYAYYYVWYDFYTLHVEPALRASLGKGLSKDLRDDLDTLLFVIERLIHLMPEKLASGWHCNSLSAFLRRLLTIQCAPRYRHIGVKIFLAWFQIVKQKAPAEMVFFFSTLVPGLDQTRLPNDMVPNSISKVVLSPNSTSQTVSITSMNSSSRGHLEPLVPASAQELAALTLDSEALKLMDNILNHLITNVSCTCWTDSRGKREAFEFMLNQFRQKYLFKIFQEYNHKMDLYADNKVCESVNYIKEERDLIVKMKVLVIRWIMRIIPPQRSETESTLQATGGTMASSGPSVRSLVSPSHTQSSGFSSSSSGDQASVVSQHQQHQSNSGLEAYQIAYQVLTASRDNINMCLEILRQGLMLPLGYSDVTLAVINLLNSWLNLKEVERPIFVQNRHLEELDVSENEDALEPHLLVSPDNKNVRQKLSTLAQTNLSESLDESRLRTMGMGIRPPGTKTGRCVSEVAETSVLSQDVLRVGLQHYLQYFFRSLSAIFYIEPNPDNALEVKKLNEIRYRVVMVFRQVAVTSGRQDFPQIQTPSTWHHLINILLHATSFVFAENRHKAKCNQHFISNLINSLLVSCIMSNLFARMSTSIWDDVTQLLSSVVQCSPMVVDQWAKTANFITVKILSPNVYNFDYSTLEQTDKGSLTSGDSKRFSKGKANRGNERHSKQSSNRMKPHPSVTKQNSQGGISYPKDPIPVAKPMQKSIEAAFLGESLTTQALNQMLHGSQSALASKNVRPSSLLSAERRDLHKSKLKKTGKNMAASSLYTSKSENCLLYASLTDDALMQPDKHEEDSDSCDATESELANVSCEQRRAVEGYDSDNEASLIGGTSSGLDQSYNTESLTSELVVSLSDAGSVKFDPEGSVASHDTQMSWLHNVAAVSSGLGVPLSPPQREIGSLKKPGRAQPPEHGNKMALKQTFSSENNDRRCSTDIKPRPNSDVNVPKTLRPSCELGDTKTRNSWAGENRKSESSAVRFVEDVQKDELSLDRMAPDSESSPVAGQTPSGPDSDLDAPVFHQDQSNIEEKQLRASSEDASEMYSHSCYSNEQDIPSNVLTVDAHSPSSSPRNSSYLTSWALTSENRSIITGGEITGWTRESAFVVWRRILGVIGNVNDIKDPHTYTDVMKHLMEMHDVLQKIAENQCFVDEDGLFQLPAYVPPVAILLPWAIAGCRRVQDVPPESPICKGILLAHKLAAQIVLEYPAINKGTVTSFFQILYENMKLNRMELKQIFLEEMFKLYSANLPGSMVLLKIMTECACDIIDATLMTSPSISADPSYVHHQVSKGCIEKAIVFLGSLVCFPDHYKRDWKCLEIKEGMERGETHASMFPMASLAQSISSRVSAVLTDDNVFTNITASCYALSALCIMCASEASADSSHKWYSFNKCITYLANPLKFSDVAGASRAPSHLTSSELNLTQLSTHYIHCIFDLILETGSEHQAQVLTSIVHSILYACDTAVRNFLPNKNLLCLLVSLMLTIQDCVCKMPIEILAEKTSAVDITPSEDNSAEISLSECVHRSLKNVQEHCRSWMAQFSSQETESMQESSEHSTEHDMNVNVSPKDKLTSSSSSSSNLSATTKAENSSKHSSTVVSSNSTNMNRDTVHVVNKLWHAADLVSNVILCLMGRYPDWEGGVTKLDSAVTEADNNPAAASPAAAELTQALINNEYSQVFVHNENTIISVLELPQNEDSETTDRTNNKIVRFILRDLSGKYCYDFIPMNEQNDNSTLEKDISDSMNDTTIPCEDSGNSESAPSDMEPGILTTPGKEEPDFTEESKTINENGDATVVTSVTESGLELTSENLEDLDSLLKEKSSSSSSSTADGTGGTEHGDQGSTGAYEILEYLESPTEKPEKIPNALNEILEYLSTSEDLLDYPGQRLDSPARPSGFVERYQEEIKEMEKEMIRINEKEIELGSRAKTNKIRSPQFARSNPKDEERPFAAAARLLMQLNCFSWNNRKALFLLNKSAGLVKELKHLDTQSLRETHKFAVIYVANGQETKASILSNQGGSKEYEVFLNGLGWEVDVETHKGYLGLMPSNGSICKTTPYYASPTCEVVYHVATKMARGGLNQKWRHIGNDHVHIVWNEHCRPYRRSVMPTQFADVIIVLSPLPNKLIHVNISCKSPIEPHMIGPLFDGAIIDFAILPMLVRVTAIRANNLLKQTKQGPIFFESRQKAIESIVKRFKLMQIYEDFVIQSVNPQFKSRVMSNSLRSSEAIAQEANAVPVPTRAAQRLEALFSGTSLFEPKAKTKPFSSNFSTVHLPASRFQPGSNSNTGAPAVVPHFAKTHSGAVSKPIVIPSPSSNDNPTILRMPWRSKSLSISSGEDCSES